MHLIDTTLFYAAEGGGVGRYLSAKHQWIKRNSSLRHTILAPSGPVHQGSPSLVTIDSSAIPGLARYRFPVNPYYWCARLIELAPDIIEAGDAFVPGWGALRAG